MKELSESEVKIIESDHRRVTQDIMFILFNTSHLVRTITSVCEEIRNGLRLSSLRDMVTDASKQAQAPDLSDLNRILPDLQHKFRASDSRYFISTSAQDEA